MLVAETENLDRIHEFHVVLAQSGLAKWCTQPHSFLGLRKSSEYSDEQRFVARPFTGKYLFVYPFVKTRAWYALPAGERWRVMQDHIRIGKEYPDVDNHTTYSFGLDDQEFVVAFDTDDVAAFLDLVQRLRGTEASAWTARDTPSFTTIRTSLKRAVDALDGEALTVSVTSTAGAAPAAAGAAAHLGPPTPSSPACSTPSRPRAASRSWRTPRAAAATRCSSTTARSCARSSASRCPCTPPGRSTAASPSASAGASRRRRRSSPRTPTSCAPRSGCPRMKVVFLRSLAEHVRDGELELDRLDELGDDAVLAELVAVKGIGAWTAHMFLMFQLRRPDVLAVGDLGIRRAAQRAYGMDELPTPEELTALAEPWRPHRSAACRLLWKSLDLTPDA